MEACLAIDIGGTKLAAGVVDRGGTVLATGRRATPATGSSEELFATLADLVAEVLQAVQGRPLVCGVGCGGPISGDGLRVSPLNIAAWRDFPLAHRLADLTGLPTYVDNDAKALALGEGWVGAARGRSHYISMVVSTGVGGGIVLDGRLLEGRAGNAGHVGHVIVEPDGEPCACGGRGCLEAEASGTAIGRRIGAPAAEAPAAEMARAGTLVGRGIASVVNLLDLDLAVVGGSVALGYGAPFFAAAQQEMDRRCRISFARGAVLVASELGPVGGIVGAAALGWRSLG